ncbi:MAG: nucleotidyltransferase domain-containing protein [Candidatus Falkowbacteria bacterium]
MLKIAKTEQKKKLSALADKYGVRLFLLFGSQARGEARVDSDVDIAVEFVKQPSLKVELGIIAGLCAIYGKDIDLSIINHANPLLLNRICRDAQLLFGSERDFFNLRLKSFHRYNDYLPYLKMERELNKSIVKKYATRP